MTRRPWRGVDADLFRFTTTDLRDLHVAVMAAFDDASVLAPALNLDQVRAAVAALGWDEPLGDEALQATLTALTGWGLLEATQDHWARYSTPEEFERKNLQWSLTPRGDAAIAGLLRALESLRAAVGLQTAVLDADWRRPVRTRRPRRATAVGLRRRAHPCAAVADRAAPVLIGGERAAVQRSPAAAAARGRHRRPGVRRRKAAHRQLPGGVRRGR